MKLLSIICMLFFVQSSLHAQGPKKIEEKFINVNAEASSTASDNSMLDFYTADELQLGKIIIPIHTRFSATVNLLGGRAFLRVSSIKVGDSIHPMDWRVVGSDFQEGIPIIETDKSIEFYEDQRLTFKAIYLN